jgi:hypothetical protein
MDFEKLQNDVLELEKHLEGLRKNDPTALRSFAVGLRNVLVAFLKDRREPIRPGQIFKDAAAKNIVPGDVAPRGDVLIVRWGGNVTPKDPAEVQQDAAKMSGLAEKVLPILKAYRKEKA